MFVPVAFAFAILLRLTKAELAAYGPGIPEGTNQIQQKPAAVPAPAANQLALNPYYQYQALLQAYQQQQQQKPQNPAAFEQPTAPTKPQETQKKAPSPYEVDWATLAQQQLLKQQQLAGYPVKQGIPPTSGMAQYQIPLTM